MCISLNTRAHVLVSNMLLNLFLGKSEEKKRKSETSFNQGCLLPLTVLLINKAGIILLLFIFHAVFDCLHLAKPERDSQNQAEGTYSRDRKVCSGSGM